MGGITETPIATALERARVALADGRLPDEPTDCDLAAQALHILIQTPGEARDRLFRQQGRRRRDELFRDLRDEHFRGCSVQQVADFLHGYHAGRWQRDRHSLACPQDIIGKPEELAWLALKEWPHLPRRRQLSDVLR
jgi:hypothetical protein